MKLHPHFREDSGKHKGKFRKAPKATYDLSRITYNEFGGEITKGSTREYGANDEKCSLK